MRAESKRPSLLGIWRLGRTLHNSERAEVALAQAADAPMSPRWDYVIKRAIEAERRPETRSAIVQTTAVAAEVKHPHLVCVLDGSVSGVSPFVVMPYLAGESMQVILDRADRTALPIALWMARQVGQALVALHRNGWIHGDIKPANVIVGKQGHVTVVDLGSACRIRKPMGVSVGDTSIYAAPEMGQRDSVACEKMDVFSLGKLLWQWLLQVQVQEPRQLEAAAELVENMMDQDALRRPKASRVVDTLLQLEIQTLGEHILPDDPGMPRRAA